MAVTRSRIQLFLLESGDREIAPVEKALCEAPVPLVEVTRPHEADVSFADVELIPSAYHLKFNARLQALRPGRIVDRHRWALRGEQLMYSKNYKDVSQGYPLYIPGMVFD